jgi:hypothetical protein
VSEAFGGDHAERTTTKKRSLRGTERPSDVLNGLPSDVEPGGEPAFTWKVAFPVSSPGGKWAEQVAAMLFWENLPYCCRILPKATSDERSTIWYKRIRSHLSSEGLRYSIADAKAQTILRNRMDCG